MEMIFGDGPAESEETSRIEDTDELAPTGHPEDKYLDMAKYMLHQSDRHLEVLDKHITSVKSGNGRTLAHWEVLYHTAMSEQYVARGNHNLIIHNQVQADRIAAIRRTTNLDLMDFML